MADRTIQAAIEHYLKTQQLSITQFAERSGLNSGTLSNILNGHRFLSVGQMDRITEAMGLPEGYFYDQYAKACIESAPNWRRYSPFLRRSAELGKTEGMVSIVRRMLENPSYGPLLFELAEHFLDEGKLEAAGILYQNVAESEKYQHSERLALCEYRLFQIVRQDLEAKDEILRAATRFEGYLERLDEADQAEALLDLADTYVHLRKWERVEQLAEELERKMQAEQVLWNKEGKALPQGPAKSMGQEDEAAFRPLLSFTLHSYRLRVVVYERRGEYEKALYYLSLCTDSSRRYAAEESMVDEGSAAVGKPASMKPFEDWVQAERLACRMLAGETEVLHAYADWILDREDAGRLEAVFRMVKAANTYGYDLDDILKRCQPIINGLALPIGQEPSCSKVDWPQKDSAKGSVLSANRFAQEWGVHFFIELAMYNLKKQRFPSAVAHLLQSLAWGVATGNHAGIIRCVALFEKYREHAGAEDITLFRELIERLYQQTENKRRTPADGA
ncbi:helix-turn-helix domain-containing protein [Paenibacillus physcomitrellae]|uniref:HTH cro/C1-type domain-containing protein n=1 Tax=Paenibacillus physcomitrellae TaxID=1619311 RepID=A0ABQ1GFH8_9BACL|nr:helix-turn-helix transcriptional regulator [Paenibacillus physcomitrellae]GGA42797.1 hypothetical protein GCM10010917_30180 [Paenibacillus physcomitrellae]